VTAATSSKQQHAAVGQPLAAARSEQLSVSRYPLPATRYIPHLSAGCGHPRAFGAPLGM